MEARHRYQKFQRVAQVGTTCSGNVSSLQGNGLLNVCRALVFWSGEYVEPFPSLFLGSHNCLLERNREEGRLGGKRGRRTSGLQLRNSWGHCHKPHLPYCQDLLQNSPNSMSGVSNNPQGIVVPASALQQGNIAMTTVNSQVVSGRCREWVLGRAGSTLVGKG